MAEETNVSNARHVAKTMLARISLAQFRKLMAKKMHLCQHTSMITIIMDGCTALRCDRYRPELTEGTEGKLAPGDRAKERVPEQYPGERLVLPPEA